MYLKVLLLTLLFTALQHAFRLIQLLGYHYTLFEHSPGPCHTLDSIERISVYHSRLVFYYSVGGSVDLEMLDSGLVFISSGHVPGKTEKGRIYAYNLTHPDSLPHLLSLEDDFNESNFWPHGISAWEDKETNDITLFVINHHLAGDRVEKFHLDETGAKLLHVDTIQDQAIRSANHIVAVNSDEFYLSTQFHSRTRGGTLLEFALMLAWGTLVHYDGRRAHVVSRLFMPNGLALSANQSLLYVSVAGTQEIRVFSRQQDNKLKYTSSMKIEAHLSGLSLDPDTNTLWMAAANSAAESHLHDNHPTAHCGSRVFRLYTDHYGNVTNLREAYASTGRQMSCASSVVYYHGNLLIGAPYSPPLLCQVTAL